MLFSEKRYGALLRAAGRRCRRKGGGGILALILGAAAVLAAPCAASAAEVSGYSGAQGDIMPLASSMALGQYNMIADNWSTKLKPGYGVGLQIDKGSTTGSAPGTLRAVVSAQWPGQPAKTVLDVSTSYDGVTEDRFVLPYEYRYFNGPSDKSLWADPSCTLSGSVAGPSSYSLSASAQASSINMYSRSESTYKPSGSVGKNLSLTSSFPDLPGGWGKTVIWDAFKSARMEVNSQASYTVPESGGTDVSSTLLPSSAARKEVITVRSDNLDDLNSRDESMDLGVTASGARSLPARGIADAGKYVHVTWRTYSGRSVTKTVKVPDACGISYDAQGGTGAPAASAKVFSGYAVSVASGTPSREGYDFLGWYSQAGGKGTKYTAGQSVTLSGDLALYAAWKAKHKVITSITHGTITGAASGLAPGSSVTVSWKPDAGYFVESVMVDGKLMSSPDPDGGSHSFSNIQGDHSVSVSCRELFKVTASGEHAVFTGTGGGIKPGGSRTVTYAPEPGYWVESLSVDGKQVSCDMHGGKYVFSDVRGDHVVTAVCRKLYKVTTSASHGRVTATDGSLWPGDTFTASYAPDDGYYVESVLADGKSVAADVKGGVYVFRDIRGDHTLEVRCAKLLKVGTSITHGTIIGTNSGLYPGDSMAVEYSPDSGYYVKSVAVDGKKYSGPALRPFLSRYVFTDIREDHSISVECAKVPEVSVSSILDGKPVPASGAPWLSVKVEGMDHLGDSHVYYREVLLDGGAEKFSLPAGVWMVSVSEPDGYHFLGVKCLSGGSVTGQSVGLDLTDAAAGEAVFTSGAYRYGGFRHGGLEVNRLK